jgi:hypothetical protein
MGEVRSGCPRARKKFLTDGTGRRIVGHMNARKPAMTRFVIEAGYAYETYLPVEVGDWAVVTVGSDPLWEKIYITKVTAIGSKYTGQCRQPHALIRGGEVVR